MMITACKVVRLTLQKRCKLQVYKYLMDGPPLMILSGSVTRGGCWEGAELFSLGGAPSDIPTPTLDSTLLLKDQCLMLESLVATQMPVMSGVRTFQKLL